MINQRFEKLHRYTSLQAVSLRYFSSRCCSPIPFAKRRISFVLPLFRCRKGGICRSTC